MEISPSLLLAAVPYLALLVLLLFVFIAFYGKVGDWRKSGSAMVEPMSITLKTEKTPEQVRLEARAATRERRVRLFVILVGAWLVLFLFNESFAMLVLDGILSFVGAILGAFIQLLTLIVEQLPSDATG